MPKPKRPRFGSMGVWPRKRAKKSHARIRSVPQIKEAKLLSFPAYKAGMTHIFAVNPDKNKRMGGAEEFLAATLLECPPVKIASIRLYKNTGVAEVVFKQLNFKVEKELARSTNVAKDEKLAKAEDISKLDTTDISNVTVQVYTLPKLIDLKKTPDFFELEIGGSIKEKIEFVKNHLDKPITINDVFKEGQMIDAHTITKGKGFQGPVKRFGIGLKGHKSEKGQRAVGSLGGWSEQGHVMYRVAHAGQMGYHQRVQYNNIILKISDKPAEVNPKGGFINYGLIKSTYVMIKGSMPGPKKRLVLLSETIRPKKKMNYTSESIKYISQASQQG